MLWSPMNFVNSPMQQSIRVAVAGVQASFPMQLYVPLRKVGVLQEPQMSDYSLVLTEIALFVILSY